MASTIYAIIRMIFCYVTDLPYQDALDLLPSVSLATRLCGGQILVQSTTVKRTEKCLYVYVIIMNDILLCYRLTVSRCLGSIAQYEPNNKVVWRPDPCTKYHCKEDREICICLWLCS